MSIFLEVLAGLCAVALIGAILVLDIYFWTEYIDSDLSVLWVFLTLPFKDAIIEKKYGYF